LKIRAELKRTTIVNNIRAVHVLAVRVDSNPSVSVVFLANVNDLDVFWSQFKAEDDSVLDYLIATSHQDQYSTDLPSEVRALINECRAIADSLPKSSSGPFNVAPLVQSDSRKSTASIISDFDSQRPLSHLPEIPLPRFDGDPHYWPTFRDRFQALVDSRTNLSDVEKMYYLIGCLDGPAADAIRRIPVTAENYQLAVKTLNTRFHRPRLVATSLVDRLLRVPVSQQESVPDLSAFVSTFTENIALLNALDIPNMGSFMLFNLAFRSLPVTTRKIFESTVNTEYPFIDELVDFVQSHINILELAGDNRKLRGSSLPNPTVIVSHKSKMGGDGLRRIESRRSVTLVSVKPAISCPCCQGAHAVASCSRFKSWTVEERHRWIRSQGLCLICFNDKHWANKCKARIRYSSCSRNHHSLLHPSVSVPDTPSPNPSSLSAALCTAVTVPATSPPARTSTRVLLGTALIHIRDHSGSWQIMRAIVDCASEISAITSSCADRLNLRHTKWTGPISGLSGVPVTNVLGTVQCRIQPRFSNEPRLDVNAWVLPSITGDLPRAAIPVDIRDRFSNLALADPDFNVSSPVDLLLGGDIYSTIMDGQKVTIDDKLPVVFSSIFGWILMGPLSQVHVNPITSLPVSLTVSIEGLVKRFWQVEEPEAAPASFTDNGRCEEIFRTQYTRLPSGRFSVPLPFRFAVTADTFSGSRLMAEKRFKSLERKLASSPKLKSLYADFMSEYLTLGHMSVAKTPGTYFIPHHAVYRPADGDGKIRVVFDASARGSRGPSLNDCLLQGPKLQQDMVDVLTRFRVPQFVFTTDICKMYRQILILPEYRTFQHIFWRPSPLDKLVDYELDTVTYGTNRAPFLALRVLKSVALNDCTGSDAVRDALLNQTYVDDVCAGVDSTTDVLKLQSELNSILGRAGMQLKKWSSNNLDILNAVPANYRVHCPQPFDTEDECGVKVLSLQWHPTVDIFSDDLRLDAPITYTKRGLLSLIARIFDPLGLFAPTIFYGKCIMQRTWSAKITWDEPLPSDILREWASFVSDLSSLSDLKVPCHFNTHRGSPCLLLGFYDASQQGDAAVLYIKVLNHGSTSNVFLVGTKTKLALTKPLSIPRLELNAALLLSRWMNRIQTTLSSYLNIVDLYAWSDSAIV
jgi:hypothetical protein